jgi:type II secretory pathway component HofQ
MRISVLITCLVACLAAAGCNRWEWKWPNRRAAIGDANAKEETKPPTSRPVEPKMTPHQEIAQLQRQIKTLRERLEVIEDENAKLRKTDEGVEELRKALKQQTFTAKMQAEDLKILKTAAVERDLYKTRSERLQREVTGLKTRIVDLLKKLAGNDAGTDPGKAPATKPAGT